MAYGFFKGAVWGTFVSAAGVACLSVFSEPPQVPTVTAHAPGGALAPEAVVDEAQRSAGDRLPITGKQAQRAPAPAPDSLQQVENDATETASQPLIGAASVLSDGQGLSNPTLPDVLPQVPSGQAPVATHSAGGLEAPDADTATAIDVETERPAPPASDMIETQVEELAPETETTDTRSASVLDTAPEEVELSISVDPVQPAAPAVPESTEAFPQASEKPDGASVLQTPMQEQESPQSVVGNVAAAVAPDAPLQTAPQDFAAAQLPDADMAFPATSPVPARTPSTPSAATLAPAEDTALAPPEVWEPAPPAEVTSVVPRSNSEPSSPPVRVNRLPTLGGEEDGARQPSETVDPAPVAEAVVSELTPFELFAAAIDTESEKPKLAIVLMDDGVDLSGEVIGLSALRSFPYPVSFAVDPLLPDAPERMRAYRAEGFEVLATVDFPEGAKAQDAEVSLTAALEAMPEVFAVLEGPTTGVQTTREAANHVTAFLSATGHGFVAQNKGLNTVQKLAARSGVPSAVVFRDFDKEQQSPRTIRRFLDQAAFRAGQEGDVVMLGRLRPDTISALLLWGLEDRADRVALVPVSNVLNVLNTQP